MDERAFTVTSNRFLEIKCRSKIEVGLTSVFLALVQWSANTLKELNISIKYFDEPKELKQNCYMKKFFFEIILSFSFTRSRSFKKFEVSFLTILNILLAKKPSKTFIIFISIQFDHLINPFLLRIQFQTEFGLTKR